MGIRIFGYFEKTSAVNFGKEKIQFKSSGEHILKISLKNSKGEEFLLIVVFTSQRAVGNKQELESHENPDEPNIKSKSLAFRAFYAFTEWPEADQTVWHDCALKQPTSKSLLLTDRILEGNGQ